MNARRASYDAIIIGAGPAGATAALLLARAGWLVAIVEKSPFPRSKVCGEFISAPALALLARSGLSAQVLAEAGPEVREIAVYAGRSMAVAPMPKAQGSFAYGRAVARDRLDLLLLDVARRAGATVYQPWCVERCERSTHGYLCTIASKYERLEQEITATIVIAAHGSWEGGYLAEPPVGTPARTSDLFAFKAHFTGTAFPQGRMPLLAFPGGYGGLVQSDGARVSFSCCIERDALSVCRSRVPGVTAGAAVLAHILRSCRGAEEALSDATLQGRWLGAGPIRPGIRSVCGHGFFAVGNALGEAHPIVAEGISMAVQSAWLVCAGLTGAPRAATSARWNAIARDYESVYRRSFWPRIQAASAFAALAMRPHASGAVASILAARPELLMLGARWAGKIRPLRLAA